VVELLIILPLVVAVIVGIALNRRWAPKHDGAGLDIADLINPIVTIAAILLAFVMVEALASYGRARDYAGAEARVVDEEAESAGRLGDRVIRLAYETDLVCYARAVRFHEWPSMARGADRSPTVDHWTGDIERLLSEVRAAGGDGELDRLIDFDSDRGDARLARLSEAEPSLPTGLVWLMLGSVVVSVFGLALFMKSDTGRRTNFVVLLIFGALVGGTFVTIIDLDRPFDGFNSIDPAAMARTEAMITRDIEIRYPVPTYPCDATGIPLVGE